MNEHTSGPWRIVGLEAICNGRPCIGIEDNEGIIAEVYKEANARLVACAPELLCYVKEFEHYLRLSDEMPGVQQHLKALIARAEGES